MSESQLDLLPALSKDQLKEAVARIASNWPPYDKQYNEVAIFADIDAGEITSEEQIDGIFQTMRMLWL